MADYYTKPNIGQISYTKKPTVPQKSYTAKRISTPSYVKKTAPKTSPTFVPSRFGSVQSASAVSGYYTRPDAGRVNTPIPQIVKEKTVIPLPTSDDSGSTSVARTPADPLSLSFIEGGPPCVFGSTPSYTESHSARAAVPPTSYPYQGVVTADKAYADSGILGGIGSAASTFGDELNTNLLILLALIIGLGLMLGGGRK